MNPIWRRHKWKRTRFSSGEAEAFVFLAVFGQGFPSEIEVPRRRYDCAGLAPGLGLERLTRAAYGDYLEGLTFGRWRDLMQEQLAPSLASALLRSPEVLVIEGSLDDPKDLTYLRDLAGLVAYLLDEGGEAVFDPQALKFWDAASWRERLGLGHPSGARRWVRLIEEPEEGGGRWWRSRGQRVFARPDLSLRGAAPRDEAAVSALMDELIEQQIQGERFGALATPLPGWRLHLVDGSDDPAFENHYYEIELAD